jgi:hypothetical protein
MSKTVLLNNFEISENTLYMMDHCMENFAKGIVSDPIDIEELKQYVDKEET